MNALSAKQIHFRNFLLERIGFFKGPYLDRFIEALDSHFLKVEKIVYVPVFNEESNKFETQSFSMNQIDWLQNEITLKEGRKFTKKPYNKDWPISATDLANYVFCPASYVISNTYETPQNSEMIMGSLAHEESNLMKIKRELNEVEFSFELRNYHYGLQGIINNNLDFFNEIKNSKIIYSGHQKNNNKPFAFHDLSKTFIGQPDFVFENKDGKKFIVEEKYKNLKEEAFYLNNKVQLGSYIFKLEEFNAEYGYLVHWYSSYVTLFDDPNWGLKGWSIKDLKISKCNVLKIERDEDLKEVIAQTENKINALKQGLTLNFDKAKLNAKKCIKCSFNSFCGHKTGRYSDLAFPYQDRYNNVFFVKYEKLENL